MRTHSFLPVFSALAVSTAFLLASPAMAEVVKYKATLDGSQQSPPVTTKGKGTATFTFDTAKKKLSWNVKYSGLSGPATAAHIHAGRPGRSGAVLIPLCAPCRTGATGTVAVPAAAMQAVLSGATYVNVHTKKNPGGEVRGQLTVQG